MNLKGWTRMSNPSPPLTDGRDRLREDIGLSIDMIDADRLRAWGRNIVQHGDRITEWGSTHFVSQECQRLADAIAEAVTDIGQLRAEITRLSQRVRELEQEWALYENAQCVTCAKDLDDLLSPTGSSQP